MRYNLRDLCEIKYGKNQKKVEDSNGTVPILGTGGLMGYANQHLYNKPSVLIPRKGSISKVAFSSTPFWTVDTLFYTIVNEEIVLPKYLYYVLSRIDLNRYNEGTTIPSLRTETLNRIELDIPNIDEQQQVVEFMDVLEEKLKVNQQIINKIVTSSGMLFTQWFINFDFPNKHGQPYKSSGGKMVESELGIIPESFNALIFDEIAEIMSGATPSRKKAEYFSHDGIPWITPKDLSIDKSLFISHGQEDITQEGFKNSSTRLIPKNSILFSSRAPIGYIAINVQEATTNQGFKNFVPKNKNAREFIFLLLKHLTPEIEAGAGGSTFKEVSGSTLKKMKVVVPDDKTMKNFSELVESLFTGIFIKESENKKLTDLKNYLLPKLLSGEIGANVLESEKV